MSDQPAGPSHRHDDVACPASGEVAGDQAGSGAGAEEESGIEQARAAAEQAWAAAERAGQAQAVAEADHRFGLLLLTMSEALTATTTVAQVAATVTDVLAPALGAAGGGLLVADKARTRLDFVTMTDMPETTDAAWSRIGWGQDAPLAAAVRERRSIYYVDNAALLAAHPGVSAHAALPAMGASVNLPLITAGEVIGALFLFFDRSREVPAAQRDALEALARYTAQAVQRAMLSAERRHAAQVLQQSLLTRLPQPDHLELRARYVPAALGEHVGGDWYDAVVSTQGATTLILGDVTGHDMTAAAHMGQLRGLLRAFAYDRDEPPAQVVRRLERASAGLGVEGLATLVVARIEQTDADAAAFQGRGARRLRWTNAGHPPPIVLHAGGSTQVLETVPELLVGLVPETTRTDHTVVLAPQSTLLLYSDGLIEHRGRSITDGIEDLRRVLAEGAGQPVQQLLDHVVAELVGDSPEDDCAILAVRAHREDLPRPAEAGPGR